MSETPKPEEKEAEELLEDIDQAIRSVGKPVEEWSEADFDKYERVLLGGLVQDGEAGKAVPSMTQHLEDLAAENPAYPLFVFLRYFDTYETVHSPDSSRKKAPKLVSCEPRLNRPPPAHLLEYIAKHILAWWKGSGSLDDAFRLKATGSGNSTPKELLRGEMERTIVRATVQGFRDGGVSTGKAIEEAAEKLGKSEEAIRDLRRPSKRKRRRKKHDQ